MFPLLSLATEIILSVVESIDDPTVLVCLAQTCKELQPLAEAQNFKTLQVRHGQHAQDLAAVLDGRPERFKYVQTLEVTPNGRGWQGIQIVPSLVKKMGNLRELWVESPMCNGPFSDWWIEESQKEYMEMFREANSVVGNSTPLRNLRSFKYMAHGIGTRLQIMTPILPIFYSPTLTSIHISCLHVAGILNVPEGCKTPLKTLILEECSVEPSTLHDLLSLPRNLASLSIREATTSASANEDILHTLGALRQQKHSLRFLQHSVTHRGSRTHRAQISALQEDGHGFSDFPFLTTLELSRHSLLISFMVIPHMVPPALISYSLTDVDFDHDKEWERMLSKLHISGLTVDIHRTPGYENNTPLPFVTFRVNQIVKIAQMLKERCMEFRLSAFQIHSYVPPYLFGEQAPTLNVHFESSEYWKLEEKYRKEMEDKTDGEERVVRALDSGTVIVAKLMAGYRDRPSPGHRGVPLVVPEGYVDTRIHPLVWG